MDARNKDHYSSLAHYNDSGQFSSVIVLNFYSKLAIRDWNSLHACKTALLGPLSAPKTMVITHAGHKAA